MFFLQNFTAAKPTIFNSGVVFTTGGDDTANKNPKFMYGDKELLTQETGDLPGLEFKKTFMSAELLPVSNTVELDQADPATKEPSASKTDQNASLFRTKPFSASWKADGTAAMQALQITTLHPYFLFSTADTAPTGSSSSTSALAVMPTQDYESSKSSSSTGSLTTGLKQFFALPASTDIKEHYFYPEAAKKITFAGFQDLSVQSSSATDNTISLPVKDGSYIYSMDPFTLGNQTSLSEPFYSGGRSISITTGSSPAVVYGSLGIGMGTSKWSYLDTFVQLNLRNNDNSLAKSYNFSLTRPTSTAGDGKFFFYINALDVKSVDPAKTDEIKFVKLSDVQDYKFNYAVDMYITTSTASTPTKTPTQIITDKVLKMKNVLYSTDHSLIHLKKEHLDLLVKDTKVVTSDAKDGLLKAVVTAPADATTTGYNVHSSTFTSKSAGTVAATIAGTPVTFNMIIAVDSKQGSEKKNGKINAVDSKDATFYLPIANTPLPETSEYEAIIPLAALSSGTYLTFPYVDLKAYTFLPAQTETKTPGDLPRDIKLLRGGSNTYILSTFLLALVFLTSVVF